MHSEQAAPPPEVRVLGRYVLYREIGAGGMASVHLGRLRGAEGFSRTVAIKKLHAHLAKDPSFSTMFLDEARLAARIRHPNVVQTLDVVARKGELFLVMEYVHGESLAVLQRGHPGQPIPAPVAATILSGVCMGLHAAHDAVNEQGEPMHLVHRDVSPHNILVGADGVARVLDFGIAKAIGRAHTTQEGQVKGKLAYMAPEQIRGAPVTRRTDVFGAGVVLWGALTGRRLFDADNEGELLFQVLEMPIRPPSRHAPGLPPSLDEVVLRALARDPDKRFDTAREMAAALERAVPLLAPRELGEWLERTAGDDLARRAAEVADVERTPTEPMPPSGPVSTRAMSERVASTTSEVRPRAEPRSPKPAVLVSVALCVGVVGAIAGALLRSTAPPATNAPSSEAAVAERQPVVSSSDGPPQPTVPPPPATADAKPNATATATASAAARRAAAAAPSAPEAPRPPHAAPTTSTSGPRSAPPHDDRDLYGPD